MAKTDTLAHDEICDAVQSILDRTRRWRKYDLKVASCTQDEDWTLVVVTPSRPGIRAYEYVEILSKIEDQLKTRGYDHVLLLPTLPG